MSSTNIEAKLLKESNPNPRSNRDTSQLVPLAGSLSCAGYFVSRLDLGLGFYFLSNLASILVLDIRKISLDFTIENLKKKDICSLSLCSLRLILTRSPQISG